MNVPVLNRILMIDDESAIQTVARRALEALGGFTVQLCSSGSEAVMIASTFKPDVILLDVMMPDMDGPATLKALREQPCTAAIPVIFMMAKVQAHEVVRYKGLGGLDVIAKPFNPMTLSATIRQIWEHAYT